MNPLPKNISRHPDGYLVRLERSKILYQGFIGYGTDPFSSHVALRLAVALRDKFLVIAGGALAPSPRGADKSHSNTGIPGISETVKWVNNRPLDCFTVYLGKHRKPKMKRVYYGSFRTRKAALEKAIEFRRNIGAVIPEVVYV